MAAISRGSVITASTRGGAPQRAQRLNSQTARRSAASMAPRAAGDEAVHRILLDRAEAALGEIPFAGSSWRKNPPDVAPSDGLGDVKATRRSDRDHETAALLALVEERGSGGAADLFDAETRRRVVTDRHRLDPLNRTQLGRAVASLVRLEGDEQPPQAAPAS